MPDDYGSQFPDPTPDVVDPGAEGNQTGNAEPTPTNDPTPDPAPAAPDGEAGPEPQGNVDPKAFAKRLSAEREKLTAQIRQDLASQLGVSVDQIPVPGQAPQPTQQTMPNYQQPYQQQPNPQQQQMLDYMQYNPQFLQRFQADPLGTLTTMTQALAQQQVAQAVQPLYETVQTQQKQAIIGQLAYQYPEELTDQTFLPVLKDTIQRMPHALESYAALEDAFFAAVGRWERNMGAEQRQQRAAALAEQRQQMIPQAGTQTASGSAADQAQTPDDPIAAYKDLLMRGQ